MSEQGKKGIHNLVLEGRQRLTMSGVREVVGFEEETIVLKTEEGGLTIKGEGMKIGSFSTGSGDIDIEGNVVALIYTDGGSERGFLRRLLK